MATNMGTKPPEGFRKLAWYRFDGASRSALWKPSVLHLETQEMDGAICGARPGRRSTLSSTERDFQEHEQERGLCSRCWPKAHREAYSAKMSTKAATLLTIILHDLEHEEAGKPDSAWKAKIVREQIKARERQARKVRRETGVTI